MPAEFPVKRLFNRQLSGIKKTEPDSQSRVLTRERANAIPTPHKPALSAAFLPRIRFSRSACVITLSLAVTLSLWLTARYGEMQILGPWRCASQVTVLWSATLSSLAMLAVVRAHALEPFFGGLDRAVKLHRKLGLAAILMLVAHVIFLTADAVDRNLPATEVLVPFSSPTARSIDILVFYGLIALGLLAYDKRLRYERWLFLHRGVGLLFVLGTLHAAIEPGTIRDFEPLRTWIIILLLIGAASWAYRVLLFRRFGPRYAYRLEEALPRDSETIDLVMRPVERRMMYEPGTFVFLGAPTLDRQAHELHPFSISSTPVDRDLRVSVRQLGDFTQRLSELQPGDPIDIYGPFGSFSPQRFARYRRLVWVGAGIGITPFLGMLAFERHNHDFRRIWLYYVVHDADHAPYDTEIADSFMESDSFIDYTLWDSSARGRITARQIAEEVAPLDDYAVMLCGTPDFVAEMFAQFRALGLPRHRIIAEDLTFR